MMIITMAFLYLLKKKLYFLYEFTIETLWIYKGKIGFFKHSLDYKSTDHKVCRNKYYNVYIVILR